ncbi:MAG: SDR family NAD(P)-dependent oxidoreductase [Lysobacterales bacterium]|nr:SDR family NAD(P)-dependent oxidoreductase [Rhodanobacteraceae bacterium]
MMAGQRVLVTGAGSGLGRELALCYARRGDRVACVDLYADRADETVRLLPGGGHLALVADVGSDAAMAALKAQVMGAWSGLDVLVNNAGIACGGECARTSAAEWQRTININLMGVVRGVREFVPMMEAQGSGRVINVASFAGLAGAPGLGAYGVSKAGVVALSEGMRAELQPKGIHVSVLCPSFFKTNLLQSFQGENDVPLKHVAAKLMESSPINAADVARYTIEESERGRFLLLPHKDTRIRWWLKRWMPGLYFRELLRYVAKNTRKAG